MSLTHSSEKQVCPVCLSEAMSEVLKIAQVPIHCNRLWQTADEALQAPKGDMRLAFCHDCGHLYNTAFYPELMEYAPDYENSLHFSPRFQQYAETLASRLIQQYDLHQKSIIELGCGAGDFLHMLCDTTGNEGTGFDPSYAGDDSVTADSTVIIIRDFYSERYAEYHADLICCRHVLEHIQTPRNFLHTLRQAIGERFRTNIYFEVPNSLFTLKDLGIWDLIYEHCSYFSRASLTTLFAACGFTVTAVESAFNGQFLGLDAVPAANDGTVSGAMADQVTSMEPLVQAFAEKYRTKVTYWQDMLKRLEQEQRKSVIWGTGSKGVTFLNVLQSRQAIRYAVDINPHKHGKYVAGTGQSIVPPEFLKDYHPDVVVIMNPIYVEEIQRIVGAMNLHPEFLVV